RSAPFHPASPARRHGTGGRAPAIPPSPRASRLFAPYAPGYRRPDVPPPRAAGTFHGAIQLSVQAGGGFAAQLIIRRNAHENGSFPPRCRPVGRGSVRGAGRGSRRTESRMEVLHLG